MTLEDLKTADWSDITSGTYASPRDVLTQLRELAFKTDTTSVTVNSVGEEICHQGDVFETTARTIPYFIELLRSTLPSHQCLHKDLLMSLAGFYTLCQGADYNLYKETQITERAEARQRITLEVRNAIRLGCEVYLACCDDPRSDVQRAAFLLLGDLKEEAGFFLPSLRERIATGITPAQKPALFFCYARLAPFAERQSVLLPRFLDTEETFLVRVVLAFILSETEEDKLFPLLSGLPCPGQDQIPFSVREFMEKFVARGDSTRTRLWNPLLNCVTPNGVISP